jgi:hypothetical protein
LWRFFLALKAKKANESSEGERLMAGLLKAVPQLSFTGSRLRDKK